MRAVLAVMAVVGLASCVQVHPRLAGREDGTRVRTTAYTHTESDHLVYGRRSAAGTPLRHGKVTSAAADWSRFPVGTRFRVNQTGRVYEVDDYGSALVGTDTIDLYTPTRRDMNRWGARHVDIEILRWGDFEESRKILEPRSGHRHVRGMLSQMPTES